MIKVSVEGLDKALAGLRKKSADIQRQVDTAIDETAKMIVRKAVADAPKDESFLMQGISAERIGDMSYQIVSSAFYSPYIEWGTKRKAKIPNEVAGIAAKFKGRAKRGTYDQFVESIYKWVKRKGIGATYSVATRRKNRQSKDEKRKIAEAIAHSIMVNGINPKPFFWHNVYEEQKALVVRLKRILK